MPSLNHGCAAVEIVTNQLKEGAVAGWLRGVMRGVVLEQSEMARAAGASTAIPPSEWVGPFPLGKHQILVGLR